MATIRLFDHNLAGYIEFDTSDSPDEAHDYLDSIAGYWCIDFPGGAVLISGEWSADYYHTAPDEFDPYPDFRLMGSECADYPDRYGTGDGAPVQLIQPA